MQSYILGIFAADWKLFVEYFHFRFDSVNNSVSCLSLAWSLSYRENGNKERDSQRGATTDTTHWRWSNIKRKQFERHSHFLRLHDHTAAWAGASKPLRKKVKKRQSKKATIFEGFLHLIFVQDQCDKHGRGIRRVSRLSWNQNIPWTWHRICWKFSNYMRMIIRRKVFLSSKLVNKKYLDRIMGYQRERVSNYSKKSHDQTHVSETKMRSLKKCSKNLI